MPAPLRENKKKSQSSKKGRPKVYLDPIDYVPRVFIEFEDVLIDMGNESVGMSKDELLDMPGVVLSLLPKKDAVAGIKALLNAGCNIWITTKISNKNQGAVSEKIHWLQQYTPWLANRLIITPEKGILGNSEDYLIAQKNTNISFAGFTITQGKNAFLNDWTATVSYLNDKLNLDLKTDFRNGSIINLNY